MIDCTVATLAAGKTVILMLLSRDSRTIRLSRNASKITKSIRVSLFKIIDQALSRGVA